MIRNASLGRFLSTRSAQTRAGITKKSMTVEERHAERPELPSLSIDASIKLGFRLTPNAMRRFIRAAKFEDWAKNLGRPFAMAECAAAFDLTDAAARDVLGACRIKKHSRIPAGSKGRKWLYVFDESIQMDYPEKLLKRLGIQS